MCPGIVMKFQLFGKQANSHKKLELIYKKDSYIDHIYASSILYIISIQHSYHTIWA